MLDNPLILNIPPIIKYSKFHQFRKPTKFDSSVSKVSIYLKNKSWILKNKSPSYNKRPCWKSNMVIPPSNLSCVSHKSSEVFFSLLKKIVLKVFSYYDELFS